MKKLGVIFLLATIVAAPAIAGGKKHAHAGMFAPTSAQLPAQAVRHYVVNPFGEVDGLLLANGTLIKFPAHQSDALVSAIKPGDSVSVMGAATSPYVIDAWTLTTANNAVLVRAPKSRMLPKMPKHLRAMTLSQVEARGRISLLTHGKKGELKMALLEDGTSLRLGKQAQWIVGAQLAVGREVLARGVGTQNSYGRALEVTEIAIDNGPITPLYGTGR